MSAITLALLPEGVLTGPSDTLTVSGYRPGGSRTGLKATTTLFTGVPTVRRSSSHSARFQNERESGLLILSRICAPEIHA